MTDRPKVDAVDGLDAREVDRIRAAVSRIRERIDGACARVGRDPAAVTLVAVSKTVAAERVRAARAAGVEVFGENRVQEGEAKIPLVAGGRWHLIGPLQSNKARRAVAAFDVIETVDSLALAQRLDRLVRDVRGLPEQGPVDEAERLPVLVQVNVDGDPDKAGVAPAAIGPLLAGCEDLGALELTGLMTIGRLVEDPEAARPTFRALRELSERLRPRHRLLGPALSMGMSDDYPVAVEEGATLVRIGRAVFGARPPA